MRLSTATQKPWYKWCVAVACFLMIFLGMGFCSSNKSLYLGAITESLNIPRSLFSLQDTLRFAVTAVVNMLFGTLIVKFGPKIMAAVGFLGFIGYLTISIYAENVVWFYVAGCLLGVATSFCSTSMVSYMVNLWFPEKRGTVSGAIMCANGLGGALAAQIVSPMIDAEPFGYRNAYTFALIMTVITGVIAVTLIAKPQGTSGGIAKKKNKGKQWVGISQQQAIRKPYFYAAVACVFLTGMALQGIHGIAATHMKDTGMDATTVASVLSVSSLVLTCTKFLAGFSYDKLGLRKTMAFCEICGFGSFMCLAFCGSSQLGTILAFGYAILSPLALPLETVLVPLIAVDLFGEKDFSKLLGYFVAANYIGYAVGGFVCNLVFDLAGSYVPMLLSTAVIMLAIAIVFQFVIKAADKIHEQVMAQTVSE